MGDSRIPHIKVSPTSPDYSSTSIINGYLIDGMEEGIAYVEGTDNSTEYIDWQMDISNASYAGADQDRNNLTTGSEVVHGSSTGGTYAGKMNINSLISYADCWASAPRVYFYREKVIFGYPTENSFTLNKLYYIDRNGKRPTGRLNIKSLDVNFEEASSFDLNIDVKGRESYKKHFNPQVLEYNTDIINTSQGTHKFGINSNAENLNLTIENNTPFRSRFVGIGYEGQYINRSK